MSPEIAMTWGLIVGVLIGGLLVLQWVVRPREPGSPDEQGESSDG